MVIMTPQRPAHWQSLPDRPLTVDDLEHLPDEDGYRYELVDGRLDVSPRPKPRHITAQQRLSFHLTDVASEDFMVQSEPGLVLSTEPSNYRIPDLTVIKTEDYTPDEDMRTPPVLAIEMVSPASAFRDYKIKASEYAKFGIPSYWIIEPSPVKPHLIELRLDVKTGEYREAGWAYDEGLFETDFPFPVKVVPYWLVADGPWKQGIGGDASG